jgi:hypothetical protein
MVALAHAGSADPHRLIRKEEYEADRHAADSHHPAVRLWSCLQRSCDFLRANNVVIKPGFVTTDPDCGNHTEDRKTRWRGSFGSTALSGNP